jgi:type I restriction enzyme S subunit
VFLGIQNITSDGHLDLHEVRCIAEEDLDAWTRRVTPQPGDIVFTYEATLHRYAIIPSGFRGCLGRRLALIRPDAAKVDTRFLHYCLLGDDWRRTVTSKVNIGSTVDRIPLVEFPRFELPLPPLPTQRKIAAILSAYDDLIENNLRRIKILEEMAQRLYREWFVNYRFPRHEKVKIVQSKVGKVPEGWEALPFTEIADVLSGGTPKTTVQEYWGGPIPFFAPIDAPESFYVTNTAKAITEAGLTKCSSKLYPKDTVFITARGTVGKVVMPSQDMAMNQSCYALRGKQGISQPYLFLATREQVDYLKKNTGGATFDTIVVDTFRRMFVAKPGNEVIAQFSQLVHPVMELILKILKKNAILRHTRDLLLPKLISGDLDVSSLDIAVPDHTAAELAA